LSSRQKNGEQKSVSNLVSTIDLISPIPSQRKQKMTISSKPASNFEVVPDGNWVFSRCICCWLTGATEQRHNIRSAVVFFMKEK
jgi:hypothetical protein